MQVFKLMLFCFLLVACSEENTEKQVDWNLEKSTDLNKELAIQQEMDIAMFLELHKDWIVHETGTGLRYVKLKETTGDIPKVGDDVEISYTVSLLDGKEVYKTPSDELDVFRVDNSEMESGIHEGIKLMRVGEKCKLIFPSHLAHGLVGDLDKIPPLSPLVVDIELIAISK